MIPKQFRIHAVLIVACLVMIIFPMLRDKPDPVKAELAVAATTDFLALLDANQHATSWETAATLMRERIPKSDWVEKMQQASARLGAPQSREQSDISYSTMAHDSPDGEYIVLKYATSFQKQKDVTEVVTVMLEQDGRWRVAGYYVQ